MMTTQQKIQRLVAALIVVLVCGGTAIFCQDVKPTTPAVQVPSGKDAGGKVGELQAAQARLIKLQMEFLELQKQLATCQQQTLAGVAQSHEANILKSVGAKPGQKFDWNTLTVTTDAPPPAVTKTP